MKWTTYPHEAVEVNSKIDELLKRSERLEKALTEGKKAESRLWKESEIEETIRYCVTDLE